MIALPRRPGWCPTTPFDEKQVVQAEVDLKEDIVDYYKSNDEKDEMLLTLSPCIRSFFEDLH